MRYLSAVCLLVLVSLSPAIAQSLSVGIKAGARLNRPFDGYIHDESKRYTLGPMLDWKLPKGFGLEFDALYRPEGYTAQNFDFNFSITRERSNSWEFPIIAKYRFPGFGNATPYVGLGYAPRVVKGSKVYGVIAYDLSGRIISVSSTRFDTDYDTTHGFVMEGGLSIPMSPFRISPEIRYTRWNQPFLRYAASHGYFYGSQQDQIELLFGFTWH